MRSYARVSVWVVTGFVLVLAAPPVAGRIGQGSGQMQQGMAQHAGMQGAMSSNQQMMRNIDTMMAASTAMMRDFRAAHEGMTGQSHDQIMSSMQGMLDQMRRFQGAMNGMAKDEAMMHDAAAMKAFQQAGRDLQQMGKSYQSMMKNLDHAMKGAHRGGGK